MAKQKKVQFLIEISVANKLSDDEKSKMIEKLKNTTHTTLSGHGLPLSAITVTNGEQKK